MWGQAKSRESSFSPLPIPCAALGTGGAEDGLGARRSSRALHPKGQCHGGVAHALRASRGLCALPGPLLQPQRLHNRQTFHQGGGEGLSRGGGRRWMRVVQPLRGRTGAAAQDGGFAVLIESRGRAGDREGGWEHVVSKTEPKTWPGIGYLSRDGPGEAGEGLGTAGHGSNPVPIPAQQQMGLAGHFSLVSCSPGCSLPTPPCPHSHPPAQTWGCSRRHQSDAGRQWAPAEPVTTLPSAGDEQRGPAPAPQTLLGVLLRPERGERAVPGCGHTTPLRWPLWGPGEAACGERRKLGATDSSVPPRWCPTAPRHRPFPHPCLSPQESQSTSWHAREDDEVQPGRRGRARREDKEPAQPMRHPGSVLLPWQVMAELRWDPHPLAAARHGDGDPSHHGNPPANPAVSCRKR
ncbi:uncharacterized protein ACIBXB_011373 [Morphnus guianensis]